MPIYEYKCSACSEINEILQKFGDGAPKVCPNCGKQQSLTKVVSQTSFQLKGGGWYKDLYSSTPKSGDKKTSDTKDKPKKEKKAKKVAKPNKD